VSTLNFLLNFLADFVHVGILGKKLFFRPEEEPNSFQSFASALLAFGLIS